MTATRSQWIGYGVMEATALPDDVNVDAIAEDALQAAFKVIADQLGESGYPVTGDVAPDEAARLDDLFRSFVRCMALNNDTIGAMQT